MRRLLILLLFLCWNALGAFTEFYVQTTGNNLNSGHTPDDSATFTATGGFFTNNTSASVCTYFKSGLNPVAGGVTNGAWASIYPDATATNAVYVGLITAADDTADTITVSLTAKSGTVPASDTSGGGATSIKVGGAWSGPNTNFSLSVPHPFHFVQATMTNTSGNVPYVNIKSAVYSTTNTITCANVGPIWFGGYTSTVRDGGRFSLTGGNVYPAFAILQLNGSALGLESAIVYTNGGSGSGQACISAAGTTTGVIIRNTTVFGSRGAGINPSSEGGLVIGCDVYACNLGSGGGTVAGIQLANSASARSCMSYSNNCIGMTIANGSIENAIAYRNASGGFAESGNSGGRFYNCDAWDNTGAGFNHLGSTPQSLNVINCNAFKNSTFGINSSGSTLRSGLILNCSFGSGTQTNSAGSISTNITVGARGGIIVEGTQTYTADQTPWVDPTNGNFTISASALTKAAGYSKFIHSFVNSPTNTVSYPDIGAAQSASTNSASAGGAYTWAQ